MLRFRQVALALMLAAAAPTLDAQERAEREQPAERVEPAPREELTPAERRISRRTRRDGVHIRVARNYHLPADQIVSWPVIVIGGTATIDGRVEDDLVVIGGDVKVGPTAQIRGDLTAIGGNVDVAGSAEVSGEIHNVSVWWPEFRWVFGNWLWGFDQTWWALFGLAGTLMRLTLTLVGACFIALIAPQWIRSIEHRVADAPVSSGLVGLITEIGFVPVLLLLTLGLVVSIVGIPLLLALPFGVFAFVVIWMAGFAGVAAEIGGRLRGSSRQAGLESPVLDVACGVLILGLLTVLGNVLAFGPRPLTPLAAAFGIAGVIVEYLAWTVGLGAALSAPLGNRWRPAPPPLPAHTPASVTA